MAPPTRANRVALLLTAAVAAWAGFGMGGLVQTLQHLELGSDGWYRTFAPLLQAPSALFFVAAPLMLIDRNLRRPGVVLLLLAGVATVAIDYWLIGGLSGGGC